MLVNDAAISGAPLDEIKQEIVAMYCSFLGSLYEHKRVEDDMRRALGRERELNELKIALHVDDLARTAHAAGVDPAIERPAEPLFRPADRGVCGCSISTKSKAQVRHLTS